MKIEFAGKHLEIEDDTRSLAAGKLDRLLKFLAEPIEAHIVLEASKFRHSAEIKVRCGGREFVAREEAVVPALARLRSRSSHRGHRRWLVVS